MLIVRWLVSSFLLLTAAVLAALFGHMPAGVLLIAAAPLATAVLYLLAVRMQPPRGLPPL